MPARARRSPSILDRVTAWSPVLLLGALAALTYWLDAQVKTPGAPRDGSARHDPDLYIEDFRALTLDSQGRIAQLVAAKRARHFGDDQSTEFEAPSMAMSEPGQPVFRVTADRGRLSGDREDAYFTGNVRAVRESSGPAASGEPSGPITVTTEYLHVRPDHEIARTDQAVTIEDPRGIIRAVGLEIDNKARTVKLSSNVRGTLMPRSLPK